MSFHIEVLSPPDVVSVVFSGVVTIPQRLAALEQVIAHQRLTDYKRVLLDFQDAWTIARSDREAKDFAARLAAEPALRQVSVAIVGTTDHTAGIELIAALRGFFFQRFSSRQSALRWLT